MLMSFSPDAAAIRMPPLLLSLPPLLMLPRRLIALITLPMPCFSLAMLPPLPMLPPC